MKFSLIRLVKYPGPGSLKAFCDIAVGDRLLIKGIRVVQGRHGHFVSMPRQKSKNGKWYDSVVPLTKEAKVQLSRMVLEAFEDPTLDASAKEDDACNWPA